MKLKVLSRGAWLAVLLVLVAPLQAAQVEGLHRAEIPVKGQARDERLQVYSAALAQVIIKLSGERLTPDLPELSSLMASASSLVQRFHYRPLPESGNPVLKEEGYSRYLVVEFDGEALSKSLVEAGVPLWDRTRPAALIWVAVEDRGARYVLASNSLAELEDVLNQAAQRRGVPTVLPLMDMEDRSRIDFVDIWGNFRHNIIESSARYEADVVLVGRLRRDAQGSWQGRWSLYEGDDSSQNWLVEDFTQARVLEAGVDGLADRLAQRYAQVLSNDSIGGIDVVVANVNDLAAYGRALDYLGSLDVVSDVRVQEVAGDEVRFHVDVRGEISGLQRAINLGATLRAQFGAQPQPSVYGVPSMAAKQLNYSLIP